MRLWLVTVVALQFLAAPASAANVRRALLSVDGLDLPPSAAVTAFHIETWGVEFVAICRLPKSWELKSEKFANAEGALDGEADAHGERLGSLSNMYLVDVYDYQPQPKGDPKRPYDPASFAGWVRVATAKTFVPGAGRRLALKAEHFRLKDALNCPVAPIPRE